MEAGVVSSICRSWFLPQLSSSGSLSSHKLPSDLLEQLTCEHILLLLLPGHKKVLVTVRRIPIGAEPMKEHKEYKENSGILVGDGGEVLHLCFKIPFR